MRLKASESCRNSKRMHRNSLLFRQIPTNSDQFRPLSDRFPIHLRVFCEFFHSVTSISGHLSLSSKAKVTNVIGNTLRDNHTSPSLLPRPYCPLLSENRKITGKSSDFRPFSDRFPIVVDNFADFFSSTNISFHHQTYFSRGCCDKSLWFEILSGEKIFTVRLNIMPDNRKTIGKSIGIHRNSSECVGISTLKDKIGREIRSNKYFWSESISNHRDLS